MTDTVGAAMAAARAESAKDYELRKLRREFIEMGRRAAEEIKMLRGRIGTLQPKADAYDLLEKVVHHSLPGAPQGFSEDIAWRIEREIENHEDQLVEVDPRVPDPTRHAHEV